MKHTYWKMSLPALVFVLSAGFFAARVNWKSLLVDDVRQAAHQPASNDDVVSQSTLSQIQQNLAEREYHITYDSLKSALQSPNRSQGIRAYYKPGQLTVVSRKDSAGHQFRLDLVNDGIYADGKKLYAPSLTAGTELTGNELHIPHTGFMEEYINDSSGVRQNFIVERAPEGTRSLQVKLDVEGMKVVSAGNDEVAFVSGRNHLIYRDLHCWDADNSPLPASLAYKDGQIVISVDVADADFPVTIDPLVVNGNPVNASVILEKDQSTSLMGYTVASAGDVNGDGFSDVIIGAPVYDLGKKDEGVAFIYHGSATGLPSAPNLTLQISQQDAHFASRVATAGDVNGDGFSDIIIGASLYDNVQSNEGAAFVYYGSGTGINPAVVAVLEGNQPDAWSGYFVATAGDVNGDGFSDVIVGSPMYDKGQSNEGVAFIYRGSAQGIAIVAKDTLESNQADAMFGCSVMAAGDVDGNGYTDVIVGAYKYDKPEKDEGAAFVYHGSANGVGKVPVTTLESNQADAWFGFSVAGAGDVNGDGFSDVIAGAYYYDNGQYNEGIAMVYHGSAGGVGANAAKLLEVNQATAQFGIAVASAGDVNGDGFSDVIVGSNFYDNGQSNEGGVFIYEGSATGIGGTQVSKLESDQAGAGLGNAVASAGDINGDGYSDIVVGASHYSKVQSDEGAAFVWVGGGRGMLTLGVPALMKCNAVMPAFGYSISSAGDINGDGYDDIVIGAHSYDNGQTNEGAAFVYFGGFAGVDMANPTIIESNSFNAAFGISVSGAGDVNGDGYADLIVGATGFSNGQTFEGAAFLYHGSSSGLTVVPAKILESNFTNASMGVSVASAGDVNGDGYGDIAVGAAKYSNGQMEEGKFYTYYGSADGVTTQNFISQESNQTDTHLGSSIAPAGDLNGDGYDDVIVGAVSYGDDDTGAAFVFYGSSTGLVTNTFQFMAGKNPQESFGYAVGQGGDVNADGFSDVVVGAPGHDNGDGAVFLFYGSNSGINTNQPVILKGNQVNSAANMGQSVACAGDVNGDGYSDIVVGVPWYIDPATQIVTGETLIFFGSANGVDASFLIIPSDKSDAYDFVGWSVSAAGDVNGDGFGDVITSSPNFNPGQTDKDAVFLYYGNLGHGFRNNLRIYNTNLTTPINHTQFPLNNFGAGLYAKSFLGRNKGKLVWETKPLGQGFSKGSNNSITNSTQSTSSQGTYTNLGLTGIELKNLINKQGPGTKVRVRVKYDPALALTGQVYGPWRYLPAYLMGNSTAPVPEETENEISQTTKKEATMESNEWREEVVVFPNPAFDRLHIQVKNPDQVHTMKLLNFEGEAVYQAAGFKSSIDISRLPEGVYFVVVINRDGTVTTSKVLIHE